MINSVSEEYLLNQVKLSAAVFGWNGSHVRYISLVSYVGAQILFNIYVGNKLLFLFMSRTEPFSFPFFSSGNPLKMHQYIYLMANFNINWDVVKKNLSYSFNLMWQKDFDIYLIKTVENRLVICTNHMIGR